MFRRRKWKKKRGILLGLDDEGKIADARPLNEVMVRKRGGARQIPSRSGIQEAFLKLAPEERRNVLALLGADVNGTGQIVRNGKIVTLQDQPDGGIIMPGGRKESDK